jgi:hypothetical protein
MNPSDLLHRLISEDDPIPSIVEYLIGKYERRISLEDLNSTYDTLESELRTFEKMIHETWGKTFYHILADTTKGYAIPKAFKTASEASGNLLVCDGLSIRELLVMKKKYQERLTYDTGRATVPSTTQQTAKQIFNTNNLKEAFQGDRLVEGTSWKGIVIEDIANPPRLGSKSGHMMLTQYPDSPLHHAVAHRTTKVQDIDSVINDILELIEGLSNNVPLIVTGDHGYVYLGSNPFKYMWDTKKMPRFGSEYGERGIKINQVSVAIGRFCTNVSTGGSSHIAHGGLSLTESVVPIIKIEPVK